MSKPNWIDGAEDLLDDFRLIDERNQGTITPMLRSSILRFAGRGMSSDWIAEQMAVDLSDVEMVLDGHSRKLR